MQSENGSLRVELNQAQTDLSNQVEAQRQTYREQLRKLQDEHRATVETLQGQLTRVEEQLFNLQSQNSKHRRKFGFQFKYVRLRKCTMYLKGLFLL